MQPGDTHNFGAQVAKLGADLIHKPRTVFWEWLLLGNNSPFRALLDELGLEHAKRGDVFVTDFLPRLAFEPSGSLAHGGTVERVVIRTPGGGKKNFSRVCEATGSLIALCSWMGLTDLHRENIAFGVDRHGRDVLAPLDIEMVFGRVYVPTQTMLIPSCPEHTMLSGLHILGKTLANHLSPIGQLAAVRAYILTLRTLRRNQTKLFSIVHGLPDSYRSPIRVCFKNTYEYAEYLRSPANKPTSPWIPEELEQLSRGDIPYFFRYLNRRGFFYFGDARRTIAMPVRSRPKCNEWVLSSLTNLRASRPNREPHRMLNCEARFLLLAALDRPEFRGLYKYKDAYLKLGVRAVRLGIAGEREHVGPRKWSKFVRPLLAGN